MIGRNNGRIRLLAAGLLAASTIGSSALPGFAQGAQGQAAWSEGPAATGDDTYVGRIETPHVNQNVADGASMLVSGWAVDTTASGWPGFDAVEIWNGDKGSDSAKQLAVGSVGQPRADLGEALGGTYAKSGFSAVVPASVLTTLSPGTQALNVYLHTPDKGWWYKTVPVKLQAAPDLAFPNDPVVTFMRPTGGTTITDEQFGAVGEYLVTGFALDRNPQTNPNGLPKTNIAGGGPGNVGIRSITLYIDTLPGQPGYDPAVNLVGSTSPASIALGSSDTPLNHNILQDGCSVFGGPVTFCRGDISVTKSYGPDYTFAGWVKYWDQRTVQPDMFHTLYAVAVSSVTGKSSTASTEVYVKSLPSDAPPCGPGQFVRHQCAYR